MHPIIMDTTFTLIFFFLLWQIFFFKLWCLNLFCFSCLGHVWEFSSSIDFMFCFYFSRTGFEYWLALIVYLLVQFPINNLSHPIISILVFLLSQYVAFMFCLIFWSHFNFSHSFFYCVWSILTLTVSYFILVPTFFSSSFNLISS